MRVIISGGSVVLPDTVVEGGSVVVEEGRIVAVAPRTYGGSGGVGEMVVDAHGRLVLPGLVDLHNDALETEINPRPGANLPAPFAIANLDRRLAAAGVTTEFDAIYFADMNRVERKLAKAPEYVQLVYDHMASGRALADHHVLFRVDVWTPEGWDVALAASEGARVPLISLNDHTPGQGQYRDVEAFKRYISGVSSRTAEEIERDIEERKARARENQEALAGVFAAARTATRERNILLVSHDDDTPERVDLLYDAGARIGEFPVTLEAAQRQRELGMTIVAGAPNVVRGGSTGGNLAAVELIGHGLLDALCADYHAPSMLYATLMLVGEGRLSLPAATCLVTLNPARAVGLDAEIGSLEPGKRADVLVVDPSGPAPCVELTLRCGEVSYHTPGRVAGAVGA